MLSYIEVRKYTLVDYSLKSHTFIDILKKITTFKITKEAQFNFVDFYAAFIKNSAYTNILNNYKQRAQKIFLFNTSKFYNNEKENRI